MIGAGTGYVEVHKTHARMLHIFVMRNRSGWCGIRITALSRISLTRTPIIRQWGALNNFDYDTQNLIAAPLIAHTCRLHTGTCTWITRSRRIYDVMRHACDKAAFYSCSSTQHAKHLVHKNMPVHATLHKNPT